MNRTEATESWLESALGSFLRIGTFFTIIVVRLIVTFIQNSRKLLLSRADVEHVDASSGKVECDEI